mgnify:CR=1 FL=1
MQKKIILGLLVTIFALSMGAITITKVSADENENNFPPMIKDLIDRFNLDEDEVEEYMQEQHKQKQVEMTEKRENLLDQSIEDGKITEEQKDLLISKLDEQRFKREQEHEEFKLWAKENGIDLSQLRLRPGNRGADSRWYK